jgi:hypothetical protein
MGMEVSHSHACSQCICRVLILLVRPLLFHPFVSSPPP